MEEPTPKKPRGGRPKLAPATVRGHVLRIRLSSDEYEALLKKAEAQNTSAASLMRDSVLSRRMPSPPVPAINREHYAELARLSANLNQLAKAANEGKSVTVNPALLDKLATETKRLRLALIGQKPEEVE